MQHIATKQNCTGMESAIDISPKLWTNGYRWNMCMRAYSHVPGRVVPLGQICSFLLRGQLGDILVVQTKQVQDIHQVLAVQTGRRFELDL